MNAMNSTRDLKTQVRNRSHLIRFVRILKEIKFIDAIAILGVARGTVNNWETASVPITDKIFNHVIEKFNVTEQEVRIYLEYCEGYEIE